MVGTLTSPLVDGSNFFANLSGFGLAPTPTWSPPGVGTVSAYAVIVYQLSNNGGNTQFAQIARLQTQTTSLTLPPGLLSSGQAYVFLVGRCIAPVLMWRSRRTSRVRRMRLLP